MTTDQILALARKHVGDNPAMESSARLCLEDAVSCYNDVDYFYARKRALRSLSYSIGVLHPEFQRAALAHAKMGRS